MIAVRKPYTHKEKDGSETIIQSFTPVYDNKIDENNNVTADRSKTIAWICGHCETWNWKKQIHNSSIKRYLSIPGYDKKKAIYECIFCKKLNYKL